MDNLIAGIRGQGFFGSSERCRVVTAGRRVTCKLYEDPATQRWGLCKAETLFAPSDGFFPPAQTTQHIRGAAQRVSSTTRVECSRSKRKRTIEITQRFARVADQSINVADTL